MSKLPPNVQAIIQPVIDEAKAATNAAGGGEDSFDVPSDDALAQAFTAHHGGDLLHVQTWGRWLIWDETRWRIDETGQVLDFARAVCRAKAVYCTTPNGAKAVASAKTVRAVESLARTDRQHAVTADLFDADPWTLNTPGGVVDLREGAIRPHRRDDYMTRTAAVTPGGECPAWHAFLDRVTGGDAELQAYLQRWAGYMLTGSTREHALAFLHGLGGNGKTVFLNTIKRLAGGYAKTASMDVFTASPHDRHPTELADLRGARLVVVSEVDEGKRWAEAKIKSLTGGDPISARFMRQDLFEFTPQFKLMIAGNHKPHLRNVDAAMKRRFHLIPFEVTIPDAEKDTELEAKLEAELPGIMAWAVAGAVAWAKGGLQAPERVRQATEEYMQAEDSTAQWMEDACHVAPDASARSSDLYQSWKKWAEAAGEAPGTQKTFTETLLGRGFSKKPSNRGIIFHGLRPKVEDYWSEP